MANMARSMGGPAISADQVKQVSVLFQNVRESASLGGDAGVDAAHCVAYSARPQHLHQSAHLAAFLPSLLFSFSSPPPHLTELSLAPPLHFLPTQMQSKMSSGEVDMNASIDQMARNPGMMNQMKQQQSNSEQYMLSGATGLKAQGNKLVKTKPAEAAKLYNKAIKNLTETGAISAAATTLMKACRLNLALCYLNTDKLDDAAKVCSTVLSTHPGDTKALYRRGLAYEKLSKLPESLRDFAKSAALSPSDVTVQQARDRMQTLVDALPEDEREPAKEETASNPAAKTPEELMSMSPAEAAAASMPASSSAAPTPDEMIRNNPEMAAAAQKMAAENPDMMAKMQEVMMKSGVAPGAAASDPTAMRKMQETMAKEMASNPGMAESMKSMVSSMPAEARQEMMKVRSGKKKVKSYLRYLLLVFFSFLFSLFSFLFPLSSFLLHHRHSFNSDVCECGFSPLLLDGNRPKQK